MSKNRQTQHRVQRDNTVKARELNAARQEIRQLKRLAARQQKTIRKLQDELGTAGPEPEDEEIPADPVVTEQATPATVCASGDCDSVSFVEFATPSGIVKICSKCKYREKVA